MTPKKKTKKASEVSQLEIVETCLRFLKLELSFFRRAWNWDEFIEVYHNQGCDLQKFYCNQVIGLLFGLTTSQLSKMNAYVPKDIAVEAEIKHPTESYEITKDLIENRLLEWTFKSLKITDIEGVFLLIFDKSNYQFYADCLEEKFDRIIRVDSTKVNLRSLALGISSGKAICLAGPVGSGKTTLVEYLARKTGRLSPKINDFLQYMEAKNQKKQTSAKKSNNKRKLQAANEYPDDFQDDVIRVAPKNGFLRIQLGDQTDSKILLGQYRCTDVPGEFLWQPGVLTQAVLNGYWLLLEDLDSATQDVCTVLTNLLENNFLSVPGFRENLKIAPGFQLFVTLR
jgi:midasin